MISWADGYVKANGIRIHYYRTGGDKPQVVLNHGAMDDGLCWTRVTKELEQDYDVIMLDARGHGLSDNGQGDYSSTTRATDLIEAIETLGLDKPVVGGHSMGADTCMHFAAMRPDLVRGIFMEDPPVTMPGEPIFGGDLGEKGVNPVKLMAYIMWAFKVLPKFITRPFAKKMMPISPDDEIIPWLNSKKRLSRDFLRYMKISTDFSIDSVFEVLENIKAPALLIMGDRERGSIVSKETAQEMNKYLPGLKVVHLAGANHDIRRSKFEEYIIELKTFLNEVYR
jgi:pimeloyl-ACP methyl ester carboxylesterase